MLTLRTGRERLRAKTITLNWPDVTNLSLSDPFVTSRTARVIARGQSRSHAALPRSFPFEAYPAPAARGDRPGQPRRRPARVSAVRRATPPTATATARSATRSPAAVRRHHHTARTLAKNR